MGGSLVAKRAQVPAPRPQASPGLTWTMKPLEEHCLTHRLNFRFFLFRSSRSVHVAMNTGSSSIRGSCSTCQEVKGGSHGRPCALRASSDLVSALDRLCDHG